MDGLDLDKATSTGGSTRTAEIGYTMVEAGESSNPRTAAFSRTVDDDERIGEKMDGVSGAGIDGAAASGDRFLERPVMMMPVRERRGGNDSIRRKGLDRSAGSRKDVSVNRNQVQAGVFAAIGVSAAMSEETAFLKSSGLKSKEDRPSDKRSSGGSARCDSSAPSSSKAAVGEKQITANTHVGMRHISDASSHIPAAAFLDQTNIQEKGSRHLRFNQSGVTHNPNTSSSSKASLGANYKSITADTHIGIDVSSAAPHISAAAFSEIPKAQEKVNRQYTRFNQSGVMRGFGRPASSKSGLGVKQISTGAEDFNTPITQALAFSKESTPETKSDRPVDIISNSDVRNDCNISSSSKNVLGARKITAGTVINIDVLNTRTQTPVFSEKSNTQERIRGQFNQNAGESSARHNSTCVENILGAKQITAGTDIGIDVLNAHTQNPAFLDKANIQDKESREIQINQNRGDSGARNDHSMSSSVNILGAKQPKAGTDIGLNVLNTHTQSPVFMYKPNINAKGSTPNDGVYTNRTTGHTFFNSSSSKAIPAENDEVIAATYTNINPRGQASTFRERPNAQPNENRAHGETSNNSILGSGTSKYFSGNNRSRAETTINIPHVRSSREVDTITTRAGEDLAFLPKLSNESKLIGPLEEVCGNAGLNRPMFRRNISNTITGSTTFLTKIDSTAALQAYHGVALAPELVYQARGSRPLEEVYSQYDGIGVYKTFKTQNSPLPPYQQTEGVLPFETSSQNTTARRGLIGPNSKDNAAKAAILGTFADLESTNPQAKKNLQLLSAERTRHHHGQYNRAINHYANYPGNGSAKAVSTSPTTAKSTDPGYERFEAATSRPLTLTIPQQLELQSRVVQLLEGIFGKASAELLVAHEASRVAKLIASANPAWLWLVSAYERPLRVSDFPDAAWEQLVHRTVVTIEEINEDLGIALDLTPAAGRREDSAPVNDRFLTCCKAAWDLSSGPPAEPRQSLVGLETPRERYYRSSSLLWGAPSGLEIFTISKAASTASAAFSNLSASAAPFVPRPPSPPNPSRRSKKPVEHYGRGILIKNLPPDLTLAELATHLGGGTLERIDFHDGESRTVVGVYFVSRDSAAHYRDFVNRHNGICWGGGAVPGRSIHLPRSFVEVIPSRKGGHEPIKPNVVAAIEAEGATRCLEITGLPAWVNRERLVALIARQSKAIRPAVEHCEVTVDPDTPHLRVAVVRMASLGTALGARLCLRERKGFRGVGFRFFQDPCEVTSLVSLGEKWAAADLRDSSQRLLESRAEMVRSRRASGWSRGGAWGNR